MYNPISSNVIRQSLKWMGAPKPIAISTPGPTIESKTGVVMGQTVVAFDRQALLHWACKMGAGVPLSHDALIYMALRDCFCGDVQVQPIKRAAGERLQTVTLLCSITAKD